MTKLLRYFNYRHSHLNESFEQVKHSKLKALISYLFIITILYSCNSSRHDVDLSEIEINDIEIKRYGKALFAIDRNNLKAELSELSDEYFFFIGKEFEDTLNLIKINDFISDSSLIELSDTCNEKYPDLNDIEKQLTSAFKHYKYYFPGKAIPEVYTYVSGLFYEFPIQVVDGVMIIALDMFLGIDFLPYWQIGLPKYKIRRFEKEYLVNDCMNEIMLTEFPNPPEKTFLDKMINEGKRLYFLEAIMPETHDSIKIGYTKNQMEWCKNNESNIWAFFIENELLYSPDFQYTSKFTTDGPFTSAFSPESPAKIGSWVGWQIVKSFMKNNKNVKLDELLKKTDSQKLLSESNYKPKK